MKKALVIFLTLAILLNGYSCHTRKTSREDNNQQTLTKYKMLLMEKEISILKILVLNQGQKISNQNQLIKKIFRLQNNKLEHNFARNSSKRERNALMKQEREQLLREMEKRFLETQAKGKITRKKYRDCQDVQRDGNRFSGIYRVSPQANTSFDVYCDMHTDGGGWTVFHRRFGGYVDFYRNWNDYKLGFGNLGGEHWLGNENIYHLTSASHYQLRINLNDYEGNRRYAVYSDFVIGDEATNYRLSIGSYSGNAGNSFAYHNNMMFTTKDKDNDKDKRQCSKERYGGWWYNACLYANLNGLYTFSKSDDWRKNIWNHYPGGRTNMRSSTMMIRKL